MSAGFGYNSEVWWDEIVRFAGLFADFLNQQSKDGSKPVVLKPRKLERVKRTYFYNMQIFKKTAYGKDADKHNIDRHKITALYIKSFLEVSPFFVRVHGKQELTLAQMCPNEYFSFALMNLILKTWAKSEDAIFMDNNEIEKNEKEWFIILLNHFRLDINALDVLSLAQIIYYIEDKYISPESRA